VKFAQFGAGAVVDLLPPSQPGNPGNPGTPTTPGTPTSPGTPGTPVPGRWVVGTKAKNKLAGGDGDDRLYGMSGNDTLTGAGGSDAFVFNTKLGKNTTKKTLNKKVNFDTVTDFTAGQDKLWLDNKIFKKLGKGTEASPGALNKKFFKLGKAKDKNDYLIYKKGVVYYDADGSGKKYKPVEIIKIDNKAPLTAADFFFV
jgi:hypothetical protein